MTNSRWLVRLAACVLLVLPAKAAAQDVVQQSYLKASNTELKDRFGSSIAMSGDTLVVGARDEDSGAIGVDGDQNDNSDQNSGAVYVFVRDGTSWSQQAYLKAPPYNEFQFGLSVAISGDTVVVGSPGAGPTDMFPSGGGAAFVFVRTGTTWSLEAVLEASNRDYNDWFGFSVSVSGDTAVIGATKEDSAATGVNGDQHDNTGNNVGAAYVFVRRAEKWTQQAYLKPFSSDAFDLFGASVAVSGDTIAVGASREDGGSTGTDGDPGDNSAYNSGAVYVFANEGTGWVQQAYVKASNTDKNDFFGRTLALSGDTLVVGAWGEDSLATGVNGDEEDNDGYNAGAAYVFTREGTGWAQQAYLKASNTDSPDEFGGSVAVTGNMLAVGAGWENGGATGPDGDQSDNSALNSGAVYAFERSGATWGQSAYLKASNTGPGDLFGLSVAVSGDTIVSGAVHEDSLASGVNGKQTETSVTNDTGAAYVFDLDAWVDQGSALSGTSGEPVLVGTGPLSHDSPNALGLSYAAPDASGVMFIATSSVPMPFKGGTVLPVPTLVGPIPMATDSEGKLSLSYRTPPGMPADTDLWIQFAIQDAAAIQGVSLSNAIVGTSP
jgi:hypothetical protein